MQFLKNCEKYHYWEPTSQILLAVSGGVDSMVLLDLMTRLPAELKPQFSVAHVNHQLRTASDEEEEFLRNYCQEKTIPFYSKKWEQAQHPKTGIEVAARTIRYTFFQEIMADQGFSQLVTAHHGDDQLETILMRLVRGSHLSGLTGIKMQRSFDDEQRIIFRPLLEFSKADLVEYSRIYQVPYYEDETNHSLVYTRNRYRSQIIPLLKNENPKILTHFLAFSKDLDDLLTLAQPIIQTALTKVVTTMQSNKVQLDLQQFKEYELALQSQLLNQLFIQLMEEQSFSFQRSHVQQVLDLIINPKPNGRLQLSKEWQAIKEYNQLTLTCELQDEIQSDSHNRILSLNEMQTLPNGDQIGLFTTKTIDLDLTKSTISKIWLDPAKLNLPLEVRHRQNGDRMTLKGKITRTKKIKDILIDQKISLKDRDEAYLVQDSAGKILWLIKYKESQLSIEEETDKIQYILVYQKNELY